ncbi:Tigger transposable element-derived protein 1-like 125 [Homarus americanus]|uniref:Tigger transposable element-derived protein 1-like 125 n=1 Tax=Homarus americanus TaxID=6706 RepID=A0A8J5N658_HOMAM|nr:Tigger transposable element-derived protein 1-like 125 [Homarus americanus]
MWVEDQTQCHKPLGQLIIMEKARGIFTHLQEQEGEGSTTEMFSAGRGWFNKFIHCSNLHGIRISGEALSADT